MKNTDLQPHEYHPAADYAMRWFRNTSITSRMTWAEAFASCAISGNRLAEVCSETMRRLLHGEPVSDRYLLGLCWILRGEDDEISSDKDGSGRGSLRFKKRGVEIPTAKVNGKSRGDKKSKTTTRVPNRNKRSKNLQVQSRLRLRAKRGKNRGGRKGV